jgi:hypothetical protein
MTSSSSQSSQAAGMDTSEDSEPLSAAVSTSSSAATPMDTSGDGSMLESTWFNSLPSATKHTLQCIAALIHTMQQLDSKLRQSLLLLAFPLKQKGAALMAASGEFSNLPAELRDSNSQLRSLLLPHIRDNWCSDRVICELCDDSNREWKRADRQLDAILSRLPIELSKLKVFAVVAHCKRASGLVWLHSSAATSLAEALRNDADLREALAHSCCATKAESSSFSDRAAQKG